jgi:hypothetical protein
MQFQTYGILTEQNTKTKTVTFFLDVRFTPTTTTSESAERRRWLKNTDRQ